MTVSRQQILYVVFLGLHLIRVHSLNPTPELSS